MSSSHNLLNLYRNLLKSGSKMRDYNFRYFIKRRTIEVISFSFKLHSIEYIITNTINTNYILYRTFENFKMKQTMKKFNSFMMKE